MGETSLQVHPSAPEQCLARLTASATLGFSHYPRIFSVQVLQLPVLDRIGNHGPNSFGLQLLHLCYGVVTFVGSSALNGQTIGKRILRLIDILLSL